MPGMLFDMVSGNNSPVQVGLLEQEGSTDLITLEDGTSGISIVFLPPGPTLNFLAQEDIVDLILLEDGSFITVT